MENEIVALATRYYELLGKREREALGKYVHTDIKFKTPLAELKGKDAYLKAVSNFMNMFSSLQILAVGAKESMACIVYELDIPGVCSTCRSCALLHFDGGLITSAELIYDPRPFEKKRDQIFVVS